VVATHVDVPVDESAADEGSHPVDPDVGEVAAGDGGSEGARRVHGAAGEGAGDEDVGADDESDGDGRDGAERALLGVRGGGVHGVDEAEYDDDLHHHALKRAHAGEPVGRGRHAGAELDEDGADGGAQELGHPVEDAGEDGDLAADGEAEGDGGVHVAAVDVGADGHRDEERERVAHCHGDQAGRIERRAAGQLGCNNDYSSSGTLLLDRVHLPGI
jgi:hypothetical protein